MKLAALGLVTIGIGVFLGIPGLIGIGGFWMLMGIPARMHGRRIGALKTGGPEGIPAPTPVEKPATPAIDSRTFALGILLWAALGVPSLLVGLLELGIPAEHEQWRWLPLGVGILALGIGGLSALLYVAGSAVTAAAGPPPTVPATLRIRAMRETGTYVNERPRLEFELTVEPDAGTGVASYEVTKKATVPATAMGSLRVGGGFKALVVGPDDPTAMEIHWDQPLDAGATDVAARLEQLDGLLRDGAITQAEYDAQRQRILGTL